MSSDSCAPLSTDANRTRSYDQKYYSETNAGCAPAHKGMSWGYVLVLFIVILLVVWGLIYWLNPEACRKTGKDGRHSDELDAGKAFFAALVFTFILFVILGLFWAVSRCC